MEYKWLISDVDGILTCGGLYYNKDGKCCKRFSSNDKDALRELKSKYVENIVFITSDKTGFEISKKRINEMGFEVRYFDIDDRKKYILSLEGKKIYIADGIHDAALFGLVDKSFALKDSTPQAKENCSHILDTTGGKNVFSYLLKFFNKDISDVEKMLSNVSLLRKIDDNVENFCNEVANNYTGNNKIVFCGVGKNAVLSELICEFLYPFNITSVFLDPHRAVHGNLGILNEDDILIVSSKSGNTEELAYMLRCLENKMVVKNKFLITSCKECSLARDFTFIEHLSISNVEEVSKFGLSPQTTIVKYLIVFFVLVNKLAEKKGISREEYLLNHQSGEIGKLFKSNV